ncbi:MAG: hypothetical protein GY757_38495 [bacterium]|nr:hypothetical protein [bacterium]
MRDKMRDKMRNIIDLKKQHSRFKTPGLCFSVSSRKIAPEMTVGDYLKFFYMYTEIRQLESVFGNTALASPLYGGRPLKRECSLTHRHIKELEEAGIGLALTLTNHFFTETAYRESLDLLKLHHKKGNSVICTNDQLAVRIKKEFPLYSLKASIIKQVETQEKIEEALELYDYITLPMDKNDDDRFLREIKEKDRIILFANSNCAYTCPSRSCYKGFSQKHMGMPVTSHCSKKRIPRLDMGEVYFDIRKFKEMGFSIFKLVPLAPAGSGELALRYSKKRAGKEGPGDS